MVSKSFLWGVIAASLTWTVSLYLYWSLSSGSSSVASVPTASMLQRDQSDGEQSAAAVVGPVDQDTMNRKAHVHNGHQSNLVGLESFGEKMGNGKSFSFFKEKYNRYQKEQAYRKISHKLMDELQPMMPNGTDEFGMVRNSEEQFIRDVGYRKHAFNVLVSNKIGPFRAIPDTRHKL